MERIDEEEWDESTIVGERSLSFEESQERTVEYEETWTKSSANYVTHWQQNPGETVHPSALHQYLTEYQGFQWGKDCNNWTMYTIWEPTVLKKLQFLREMRLGYDTNPMTWIEFWAVLEAGFKTFELKIDTIADHSSNYVVARIGGDEISPHLMRSYSTDTNSSIQSLKVSEFIIGGDTEDGGGYITLRCTPLTLVAGGSLPDILKATLRKNDILLAMGTVKRVHTHHSERVTLLNFDDEDGDLVFIRISFLSPSDGDVKLLETIMPTTIKNNFRFEYRVRQGKVFHTLKRAGDYTWNASLSGLWNEMPHLFDSIPVPFHYDSDIGDVYHRVLEFMNNRTLPPQTFAPSAPPLAFPDPDPVPPPPPPSAHPVRARTSKVKGLGKVSPEEDTLENLDRDMPVFSANRTRTSTGSVAPIPVQRRFSASDFYNMPTIDAMWTSICFMLILFLCCFFLIWISNAIQGSVTFVKNPSTPISGIYLNPQQLSLHNDDKGNCGDNSLARVPGNNGVSRMYEPEESFMQRILNKICAVVLWMYENMGFRFVMSRLFSNDTQPYYRGPIV